jgi:hypothetical protein
LNDPISIYAGELQRVHLINITEFDPLNSIHIHANFFHLYRTGTSLEPDDFTDTISGQAERHMLEFTYKEPGRFMFHAHQTELVELGWGECLGGHLDGNDQRGHPTTTWLACCRGPLALVALLLAVFLVSNPPPSAPCSPSRRSRSSASSWRRTASSSRSKRRSRSGDPFAGPGKRASRTSPAMTEPSVASSQRPCASPIAGTMVFQFTSR